MDMLLNSILLNTGAQGGGMMQIGMIVLLIAVFYFFMIRPQNKKQKEIQKFRNALAVGQDVVTIGGIHGQVKNIDDNIVTLEIATGTKVKFEKSAIMPAGTAPEQK